MKHVIQLIKLFMFNMPISVKLVLSSIVITWSFVGFKQIEPSVYPVVKAFVITDVEDTVEGKRISGVMNKVRDCEFEQVLAYSNGRLVDIIFTDIVNNQNVSRIEGQQAWGWWIIVPSVNHLSLYSRHGCVTGKVLTKLFEGDI